jgi:hypothetical protein
MLRRKLIIQPELLTMWKRRFFEMNLGIDASCLINVIRRL